MSSKKKKYIVWEVGCIVSMLLISAGCNSTQEYKYQKTSDSAATSDVKTTAIETPKADPTGAAKEAQTAAVKSEPAEPQVTVADILQNENSFNNRKVMVSGRIGKVFTHDKMAFLLNINNDLYIELSYEQMPESDRIALTNKMVPLQKVAISGVWDGGRKVLVADSLISPSK